jgi:hypothetical protein
LFALGLFFFRRDANNPHFRKKDLFSHSRKKDLFSSPCCHNFISRVLLRQELLDMWQAVSPPTPSLLQLTFYICSPGEMWGVWQQLVQPALSAQLRRPMHAVRPEPATNFFYDTESWGLLPGHAFNK